MSEASAREQMNRMYRYTRHVYDASRKYFLLGRDHLIRGLRPLAGESVCEVGCGTARNLIKLAAMYPAVQFAGIDASDEMLKTAEQSLERHGVKVKLAQGFAQDFDPAALFGFKEPLDKIIFSYSLSIIPPWQEALDHALALLRPGGEIHIIDFGSQNRLPGWFRTFLFRFLEKFHVRYKPQIQDYLKQLQREGRGNLKIHESLYRGYAQRFVFAKS